MVAPRGISEQVPVDGLPDFIGHVQTDGFGQVIPHPAASFNMRFGRRFDPFAGQSQPLPQPFRIGATFMVGRPIRPAPMLGVML